MPFNRNNLFMESENTPLLNQTALVTGASRGIGRAIAMKLATLGADVVCVSRTVENSQKTATAIEQMGRNSWAFGVDVSDSQAVVESCKAIFDKTPRIDILVNNAGITRDTLLMRMKEEEWDAVLDTNLKGAFLWTKTLSRKFLKQKSGRIINISSVIGLMGNAGQCNYAASKAGLIGFTKSAAREFASRGITVNAVAPGFIETDMTVDLSDDLKTGLLNQIPLNSLGKTEDIAEAVAFLAGPGARYITGQVLAVDGGLVMA
jgi:3-oxoacyl-[acyl-carrier protein] reductase